LSAIRQLRGAVGFTLFVPFFTLVKHTPRYDPDCVRLHSSRTTLSFQIWLTITPQVRSPHRVRVLLVRVPTSRSPTFFSISLEKSQSLPYIHTISEFKGTTYLSQVIRVCRRSRARLSLCLAFIIRVLLDNTRQTAFFPDCLPRAAAPVELNIQA
jgi:hypothetical protein